MAPASVEQFVDGSAEPAVRGFLHVPAQPNGDSLLLTHGAGANCQSNLLVTLSGAFAEAGFLVLRYDLPFRQARRFGPPFPASSALDRNGIARAIDVLKQRTAGRIFAGGHSYGGRQTSMLVAEQPDLVAGLLLLSYPLHPPRKPEQLRTAHFPKLTLPVLFVHGARDPFASHEEMHAALKLIQGRPKLLEGEGSGHELLLKKGASDLPSQIVETFQHFFRPQAAISS
jgi:uncharacterized protein